MTGETENPFSDDWRLMGQERYLQGATLVHRPYEPYSESWEHDHCAFCQRKLTAGDAGYTTTAEHPQGAGYHWICEQCFTDFAAQFGWIVVDA